LDSESRQAYQERLQARIAEWEKRLLDLAARSRRAEEEVRNQLVDEESELRKALEESQQRLRELAQSSEEGWKEIRTAAERIWGELRGAWHGGGSATSAEPPKEAPRASEVEEAE